MALSLVKNVTKIVIGGGALYVTYDQGIWGEGSQSTKALTRLSGQLVAKQPPYVKERLGDVQVPSTEQMAENARNTWNSGVMKVCSGLSAAPAFVGKYSEKATTSLALFIRQNLHPNVGK
ncbi:PREDICTED: MICOS complex subunit MIC13-like isoform X1 [Branchiostoma belcheri]|uniref:MICOS complex subunit MIC13 n=1 Tax=Branchiostoma belcheri TaxID=7741 RepID=A0A6P4YDL3_BRABE|nr:PREDICTED: MICOS complex subunit MIC13-like isoform X1 [Branchiostoma belcheri]